MYVNNLNHLFKKVFLFFEQMLSYFKTFFYYYLKNNVCVHFLIQPKRTLVNKNSKVTKNEQNKNFQIQNIGAG